RGALGPGKQEWSGSYIREYLNKDAGFLGGFSFEELDSIIRTKTDYVKDGHLYRENIYECVANYDMASIRQCEDYVFLFSVKEVKELLVDQHLPYMLEESYWLRDSSYENHIARIVDSNGKVKGLNYEKVGGVRPAIWIKKQPFS